MLEYVEIILLIVSNVLWYFCGRYIGEDIAFRRFRDILQKVSDELRKRRTLKQLIY